MIHLFETVERTPQLFWESRWMLTTSQDEFGPWSLVHLRILSEILGKHFYLKWVRDLNDAHDKELVALFRYVSYVEKRNTIKSITFNHSCMLFILKILVSTQLRTRMQHRKCENTNEGNNAAPSVWKLQARCSWTLLRFLPDWMLT